MAFFCAALSGEILTAFIIFLAFQQGKKMKG